MNEGGVVVIQTTIESVDTTGREVPTDPALRARVERAADLLRADLGPEPPLSIDARWRIVHQSDARPRVELSLMSEDIGVRNWVFDISDCRDDNSLRRSLSGPVGAFGRALSDNIRLDLQKSLDDQKAFVATPLASVGE